jgi:hypothetical protein
MMVPAELVAAGFASGEPEIVPVSIESEITHKVGLMGSDTQEPIAEEVPNVRRDQSFAAQRSVEKAA